LEPSHVALRAAAAYLWLLLGLRISGKRTVAQASPFDFVLALVIGDLVDDLVFGEVRLSQFAIATGTLVLAHWAVALATYMSRPLNRLVNGSPTLVVEQGRIRADALRREKTSRGELLGLLRLEGVAAERVEDVRAAWIEDSGKLSVLRKRGGTYQMSPTVKPSGNGS
jgi:uncharacterized membrane protein YcaP (DUF421 family)